MISFDGRCPLKCKYCYTYDLQCSEKKRNAEELVNSLSDQNCDIIYVSQTFENFYDQNAGIRLCRDLYSRYKKDIFVITKSCLTDQSILKLVKLNELMKGNGNQLYFGVSVCSDNSYTRVEDERCCPSPDARISNLERLHPLGIKTLLILRPVFPTEIIPIEECTNLIKKAAPYINAVVSSGLIVTSNILLKLGISKRNIIYMDNGDTDYLANIDKDKIKFVEVKNEMKIIQEYCEKINVPFFTHTLPALNDIG